MTQPFPSLAIGEPALDRPFRVLGLQQVALGHAELDRLKHLWVNVLGVPVVGSFESERENVRELVARLGDGPWAVELDLMQPLNAQAKPSPHLPALNHIGLWVDDIDAAVAWLSQQGMRFAPGGIRVGAAGHRVCFLHPRADEAHPLCGEGVLIELVQAPPELL